MKKEWLFLKSEKTRNLLKILIGIAIIVFIIANIDIQKTIGLVLGSKIEFLLLALALIVLQLALSAYNQRILLEKEKKIPFRRLFQYYCFGWVTGLVSIGKIGEFSVSYYLKKEGIPYSKSLAIVFLDKLITLALFILFAVIGTLWFFGFSNSLLLAFCILLLAGLLVFLFFFFGEKLDANSWLLRLPLAGAFIRDKKENLLVFKKTFFGYFSSRTDALAKNAVISIIKLFVMSLIGFILFLAIGSYINPFYMMFIIAVGAIVSLAPITLSGLGVTEATSIYLAALVGISPETILATEVLTRLLNYLAGAVIAVFWLKRK